MNSAAHRKKVLDKVKERSGIRKKESSSFILTRNNKGRFQFILNISIGGLKKSWAIPKGPVLSGN
jgi:hypothetical protein